MTLRWLFATFHLLAVALSFGAIWGRANALRGTLDDAGLKRAFTADSAWGVSAILMIGTGLTRLFASMEKSTAYYMQHRVFWIKMAFLVMILALEIWPMVTLIRWRLAISRGRAPSTLRARTIATISYVQAAFLVLMVFAATAVARGFGS